MIKLYKAEAFTDYLDGADNEGKLPDYIDNGEIVLQPSSCELTAELCGTWTLKMTHPYDNGGLYSYIEQDDVIKVPCKVAREQSSEEQCFRIYEIRDNLGQLEVLAKPIALDSIDEVPIYYRKWINKTLPQIVEDLNKIYPIKYHVRHIAPSGSAKISSILATDSNLQAIIMGDSDFTLMKMYGVEMVYDNYTYVLKKTVGDEEARNQKFFYGVNQNGITITENTSELITRIYPVSGDGLPFTDSKGQQSYVNGPAIESYPIVHAKVRQYDDIQLFEERSADSRHPKGKLQELTVGCKAQIKNLVKALSLEYLKEAHKGNWDYKYKVKSPVKDDGNGNYLDEFAWRKADAGWFYGDEDGHSLKNAWVESTSSLHYWVNSNGIYDSTQDNTESWEWHGNAEYGYWYGSMSDGTYGTYPKNQWMYIPTPPDGQVRPRNWYWFNSRGYLEEGENYNTDNHTFDIHDLGHEFPLKPLDNRFALPYGYIFYSYTDAIEYLKDKALMDIGAKADNPEGESEAEGDESTPSYSTEQIDHKQEKDETGNNDSAIWQCFADAIQQGFKWCEKTDIAAWDWRTTDSNSQSDMKNYLNDFAWHQDEQFRWWYGYQDKLTGKYYYIKSGWVEEGVSKHYWVNEQGYWDPDDPACSDLEHAWTWHEQSGNSDNKWYGAADVSGAAIAFPYSQYMFVTQDGKWRYFDESGIYVPDDENWWYGTKDKSDFVFGAYCKIGDYYWWFDHNGRPDKSLMYATDFDWQEETDDNGDSTGKKWYGDGNGHYFTSCWIENSASDHYYVDADGYWEEEEDEDDDDDSSDDSSDDNSNDDTTTTDDSSTDSSDDSGDDSGDSDDDEDDPDADYETHDTKEWSWHADTLTDGGSKVTRYWYGRYKQDKDGKDTDTIKYQVKDQFMYVTENNTWYFFDDHGYLVAAWLSNASWDWHHDDNGWWYGDKKGTYPSCQWMKINSKWYWFDTAGYADESTDDFKDSKTSESVSPTLDTNRDGINPNYETGSIDSNVSAEYEGRNRDGVRAWIQEGFIDKVRKKCNEMYDILRDNLNDELKERAEKELETYAKPSLSIDVNLELLAQTQGYERYKYLEEMYLGDWITIYNPKKDYIYHREMIDSWEERIVSMTYDCILKKPKAITIGNPRKLVYETTASMLVDSGKMYNPASIEELETGWAENSVLSVSKRRQNLEG